MGRLVEELTNRRISQDSRAHLDPDLDADCRPDRPAGWRPQFGQIAAAESHLRRQEVGPGDLFLFFGWFKGVKEEKGRYTYIQGYPDRHVLFGWLQIERRICLGAGEACPAEAVSHPHNYRPAYPQANNTLYLSTRQLTLPGQTIDRPGGGLFTKFQPHRCLTAPGQPKRSLWKLPGWFNPCEGRQPLSYHARPERWTPVEDHVLLQTVGQGQEFVLDVDQYPEAIDWLVYLFQN